MKTIKIERQLRRVKKVAYISLAVVALVSLGSCSDDDDEPDVPEQVFVDIMQKDKAAGSISQEEFEEKVLNKVWDYDSANEEWNWLDVDENRYSYSDYALIGWRYNQGHYFDIEKYVDFRMMFAGQSPDAPYQRVNHSYRYDPSTGMVYVEGDKPHLLFYIESVDGDKMVVHEEYMYNDNFKDPGENGYNICARMVLKAVPEDKAQKYWWDKYIPMGEK